MRKITLALLCLFSSISLWASHLQGGELHYTFNGTNYTVTATMYTACNPAYAAPDSLELGIRSASLSVSRVKYLHFVEADTFKDMYCPTASVSCSPGVYYYWIAYKYTDTVSLDTASDWYLAFSQSSYMTTILNLAANNMHLEAFLNNSHAPNNNAILTNFRPFFAGHNLSTIPLGTVDADDDSVVNTMATPMDGLSATSTGYPTTYNAGYSATYPIGSGVASISADNFLLKSPSLAGAYLLGMQTNEYRAGTLVGSSTRAWVVYGVSTSVTMPDYPLDSATSFEYTTHPGETDTVTVHFTDSTATDSVFVDFQPTNTWTYATTATPAVGRNTATISWTTPSTLDPALHPYFYIYVHAYTHDCPYEGDTWRAILVHVAHVNDSVWAGDANGDKTVNIYDPLAVAIAYGKTGPVRPGASTSWMAQYCPPWSYSFVTGINMNNADCNGDGTVNLSDLGAIITNYGLSHPKGTPGSTSRITGLPDLQFDMTGVVLAPGSTVNIPITLGSTGTPLSNLYGIAGTITIHGITPTANPSITTPATTWVGTTANTFSFTKAINTNKIDWAYAKNDHTNSSGGGIIGTISFIVPTTAAVGQQVILSFSGVKGIDNNGRDITTTFTVVNDTAAVTTSVPNVNSVIQYAAVIPNPASSYANLKLSLNHDGNIQVRITDVVGRVIWQQSGNYRAGNQVISLPSGNLAQGMYLVHVQGDGWQYPVIKWVKE